MYIVERSGLTSGQSLCSCYLLCVLKVYLKVFLVDFMLTCVATIDFWVLSASQVLKLGCQEYTQNQECSCLKTKALINIDLQYYFSMSFLHFFLSLILQRVCAKFRKLRKCHKQRTKPFCPTLNVLWYTLSSPLYLFL